jgi:hypothetical protein
MDRSPDYFWRMIGAADVEPGPSWQRRPQKAKCAA